MVEITKILFSVVNLKGKGEVEIGKLIRTTLVTFKKFSVVFTFSVNFIFFRLKRIVEGSSSLGHKGFLQNFSSFIIQ